MSAGALRLYEAVDALETVRAWIYEHEEELLAAGGDLDALPELRDLIDQAEGQFAEKVERVALFIRELLTSAKAVDEEAKRLALRAAHYTKAAESLKAYLKAQLIRADEPKVEGRLVTVRIQANPPAVKHTLDQAALRSLLDQAPFGDCVRIVPETYALDTRAIVDLWKAKAALPTGVEVTVGAHVRIV